MDQQNTRQVTEMRGAYRLVASSCLKTWKARDTNRYIRRKNRQCSGLVCLRVSRTIDAEWRNRRSSLARLYDRSCEGFRMTAHRDDSACTVAVVRKPP